MRTMQRSYLALQQWKEPGEKGEEFVSRLRHLNAEDEGADEPESGVVACEAAKGMPRTWCEMYSLPTSLTFSIAKHTYPLATLLAEQWCSRMRYFYDIYVANGTLDFIYSDEQLEGYRPLADWADAKAKMPTSSASFDRAEVIDSLVPRR